MLCTKDYGYSIDKIDWSTPNELEPYWTAYEYGRRANDELLWIMGQYVGYAIGTIFKGKYPDKPILEKSYQETSEYEIQKQRELFIAKFQAMASSWNRLNLSNNDDKGSNEE